MTITSKEHKKKRNNHSNEKGDKAHIGINRCSRLSEMLGDNNQINQESRNMAVKDKIHKERVEIKNMEREI